MSDPKIHREVEGSKGRYVLVTEGQKSVLKYRAASPNVIDAYSTRVPVALRGRGIALRLVEKLVAVARAEAKKIVPTCPYIDAQRRRHPEWSDVFAA